MSRSAPKAISGVPPTQPIAGSNTDAMVDVVSAQPVAGYTAASNVVTNSGSIQQLPNTARNSAIFQLKDERKPLNASERRQIGKSTISMNFRVLNLATNGKWRPPIFYNHQLPLIEMGPPPAKPVKMVKLVMERSLLNSAIMLAANAPARKGQSVDTAQKQAYSRMVLVNETSDIIAGNGWSTVFGSNTSEEEILFRTTLYFDLSGLLSKYPFQSNLDEAESNRCCAIYSENVVIYRGDEDTGFVVMDNEERRCVSMISLTAPAAPVILTEQIGDPQAEQELQEKVRMIFRLAAKHKKTIIMFGDWSIATPFKKGHPCEAVIRIISRVLQQEFGGYFELVAWSSKNRNKIQEMRLAVS